MITGAGIVLYNPNINRLRQSLSSIVKQVEVVILVDNCSTNIRHVVDLCYIFRNIILIRNDKNEGIAKALNQICEVADENHCEWVMTLDQDTVCSKDMIFKLAKHIRNNIGIVCPTVNYQGWTKKENIPNEGTQSIKACMTSGAMTSVEAWKKVGGFNENYFIDYVDNDFCMKLKLKGYEIIRDFSCSMDHQLGDSGEFCILGQKIRYSKHSPVRCYYMIRNNLVFIKTYRSSLNVTKEYCKVVYIAAMNIVFNDDRKQTLWMIKKAISDYKKNIMGKFLD